MFAEIAPPTDTFSPPGTENKVTFFFLIFFITSEINAPASTSTNLFLLFKFRTLLKRFNDITTVSKFGLIDLLS